MSWQGETLYFLQQCLNAIQVSAFYGLLAVAYVLVYGIANRINLAFGATAMWAGYLSIAGIMLLTATTSLGIVPILVLALAHAVIGTAILGFAFQHLVVRPLVNKPSLAILIATIGVAIILEETMRMASGSREFWLSPLLNDPILLLASPTFSIQITVMRGLILATSLTLSLGLIVFINSHRFGRVWRACSEDLFMAALCGININATLAATFLLASGYAAASGAMIALYYGNVSFYMGLVLGLKTLLVAVIGGLNSVGGALLGAFVLGFLESFWSAYLSGTYRDVAVFAILALIMVVRPHGLRTPILRRD